MHSEIAAPGEVIGEHYEVIRSLGRGGNATVFLVRDVRTDDLFAMKMLNTDVLHLEEANRRFQREAEAISKLHHENLVTLYAFGTSASGHPFFVTDFVQGKSLSKVLEEEGRLEPRRACIIFMQICDAMEYAHNAGLVHRDLKPSNILLIGGYQDYEKVRIVDFGIVKLTTRQGTDPRLTQEGIVVGSPTYMSPEQCRGLELDGRSDIYSLGCMMYEVLGGKRPFDAPYPFAILVKQVSMPAPKMTDVVPDLQIDENLESIVMKALAKQPASRFQSMAELREALEPFAANGGA